MKGVINMLEITNNKIAINRGDIGVLTITALNEDGTDYMFKRGDVIRFKVFEAKKCNCVVLQKDVVAEIETTEIDINLTAIDTTIGELINKPAEYWYEVELNPETNPQTIIGYDKTGAKVFVLYPEGGELE